MPNTTPRPPKTTTQKGLGWDHQLHRDRLLLRHVDGTLCWWCGRKMFRDPTRNWDGKPLHADHSRSRATHGTTGNPADRLLHDTCNKQRGDGSRDDQRPALDPTRQAALDAHAETRDVLGDLVYFAWPA
uniref:HNH endonuclease n=1 Tax=Mycobacterium phage JustASigh TaxID=3158894 RepID=A0AAU8GM67_9CAUD